MGELTHWLFLLILVGGTMGMPEPFILKSQRHMPLRPYRPAFSSFRQSYEHGIPPLHGRNFSWGTSPFLETVFLGRVFGDVGCNTQNGDSVAHWSILWKKFASAFQFKTDRLIVPQDFSDFFADPRIIASLLPPPNFALFWSGISELVPAYQELTGVTVMETSEIVGIMSDLMFCGSTEDPTGFNMENCVWGNIRNGTWMGTWVSFWAAASHAYARLATGNVTIILGGYPTFRTTSFFGSAELPNIDGKKITSVQILTAPSLPGWPAPEECGSGSLLELVALLVQQGIDASAITCVDQPPLLRYLRCAELDPLYECSQILTG